MRFKVGDRIKIMLPGKMERVTAIPWSLRVGGVHRPQTWFETAVPPGDWIGIVIDTDPMTKTYGVDLPGYPAPVSVPENVMELVPADPMATDQKRSKAVEGKCTCPLMGLKGLLAVGCTCGAVVRRSDGI